MQYLYRDLPDSGLPTIPTPEERVGLVDAICVHLSVTRFASVAANFTIRREEKQLEHDFLAPLTLLSHADRWLVSERYALGVNKDTLLEGWSMGKSLLAALVGILIKDREFGLYDPAPIAEWHKLPLLIKLLRKGHLKTDCVFSLFRWDTARTETVHENSTHSLREVDFWHSGGFVLGCCVAIYSNQRAASSYIRQSPRRGSVLTNSTF